MSPEILLSKGAFIGSICLILYIIYFEWKSAKVNAEKNEIKLGEIENEDLVNSESDIDLIDSINKEFSPRSSVPSTKPGSSLPGSPNANGNAKKPTN